MPLLWEEFKGKENTPEILQEKAKKLADGIYHLSELATAALIDTLKKSDLPIPDTAYLHISFEFMFAAASFFNSFAAATVYFSDITEGRSKKLSEGFTQIIFKRLRDRIMENVDKNTETVLMLHLQKHFQRLPIYSSKWDMAYTTAHRDNQPHDVADVLNKFCDEICHELGTEVAKLFGEPDNEAIFQLANLGAQTMIKELDGVKLFIG